MTYRSTPISGSLTISTPVGDKFIGYVGIGLGYYKLKLIEKSTYQNSYNGLTTDTDELESKGLAPHISLGIEFAVSRQTAIFGDLKHVVGQSKSERTREDYRTMEKTPMGGSVARIGFRVYF